MQGLRRLDIFYDRITELEEAIITVSRKINSANGEQINADTLYKILQNFDIMYGKMSDADKKQFYQTIIKSVEIDENPSSGDRLVRHIDFMFPISYEADDSQNLLFPLNDVETVALLSHQ